MRLLQALADPKLFASHFPEKTWAPWLPLLRILFGEGGIETEDERRHVLRCTGLNEPPLGPFREAWIIAGRRGGKSRIAALVLVFIACFRDHSKVLASGERGVVMLIAADRRQARTVMGYIVGLLEGTPLLAGMIERRTLEAVHLRNGVSIEVHTASYRSVRGYTVLACVADEIAFWRSEDSANPDDEVIGAIRPAMATVPGSLLLAISSPYSRKGLLWRTYQRHWAQPTNVLVWRAPSRVMNPTLPEYVVERAMEEDPAAARAEYGAEFRSDIESFIRREAVEAVTVAGRRELPPMRGHCYEAFVDPSGGSADSMTLAIGHREGDKAVLDLLREVRPPFSPDEVSTQFATEIKRYRASEVRGDRYGAAWVQERFRRLGAWYRASEKPKTDIYREVLPAINSGEVELLDDPRLMAQLVGLERRTSRSGRETIDHGPGQHDDVANVAAGVLWTLLKKGPQRPRARRQDHPLYAIAPSLFDEDD